MFTYTSSLRTASIEDTLQHARRIAREVGISRVTDTTRLDRIGVPVFAAIRPNADTRSLHVSAGKGLHRDEARIGAYMEAIELAFAEPARARVAIFAGTARDVLDGTAILELCPPVGVKIDLDAAIDCVETREIETGETLVVPAETVVFPLVTSRCGGRLYFGGDGNGIASGNSLDEATLHGLTEVIERDVTSFHNVRDRSLLVTGELPTEIAELRERLDRLGFDLWIRYLPNAFALPVIKAVVYERGVLEGMHFGYGCHVSRSIALVRAVTEALQCRLSIIHGGRDDFHRVLEARARFSLDEKLAFVTRHSENMTSTTAGVIAFSAVPDHGARVHTISDALAVVSERLRAQGLRWLLRARLDPGDLPIHIVRVLVPGLELYAHGIARMGPRLHAYLRETGDGVPESSPADTAR